MMIKVINNDELISQKQASNADKIKPCLVRSSEGNQGNRSRGGKKYYYTEGRMGRSMKNTQTYFHMF